VQEEFVDQDVVGLWRRADRVEMVVLLFAPASSLASEHLLCAISIFLMHK